MLRNFLGNLFDVAFWILGLMRLTGLMGLNCFAIFADLMQLH
jgi:hypothetical protein